ncbi:tripartite tricarboxylate transporter substrate binding protein [soil metagenome]
MNRVPDTLARRRFLAALGAVAVGQAVSPAALAQGSFPNRPITILVPFAAGGPTDASARVIGRAMSVLLGQPVIIENKPGGGGMLGTTQVAQATPDGYTLLWGGTSSLAVAPSLYPNLKFDPQKSFAPVGIATRGAMILVGKPSLPPNNIKELVAYAKEKPLNMGNGGTGTVTHLVAEYFRELTGIKMLNVPYRGGGPAITDLMAGVLDTDFDNAAFLVPYIKAGKLKPYAVTGTERHKDFPDLPTVAEVYGGNFEAYSWFGLFAPAQTPEDVVSTLAIAMAKANFDSEVRKSLVASGLEPAGVGRGDAQKFVAADIRRWSGIISRANVKID